MGDERAATLTQGGYWENDIIHNEERHLRRKRQNGDYQAR